MKRAHASNADHKCLSLHILMHPVTSSALVALVLAVFLYGNALALPLFSDDLVQIPWLESISWRELWTSPSPYGYYRPVWYSLWRVWGWLFGGLRPFGLHLLNVVAHFAASWLAGLLAATWGAPPSVPPRERGGMKGGGVACIAAALFAAFPFARQAVAWPGAVYNPLVSAMAAGALLAYDRGRQGNGKGWAGLALLLAALSALTYEAGLLVAPLVVMAEIIGDLQRRWPQHAWTRRWRLVVLAAFIGVFAVTFSIWRAMRGTGATGFGLNPADLRRNASFLIQGLVYPVAPLAQRLAAWANWDAELCLWLVALPAMGLLIWGGLRRRGMLWLGLGWFALFALPPLVSMEADWFALAPRFLYMTAAGASLVWVSAISAWLARARLLGRAVIIAILIALLIPAGAFVRDGVRLYAMAGESIWEAAEAAATVADAGHDRPILLINLPMRIMPRSRTYPLGFEGITPLPTRVTAEGLVYTHTGLRDAARAAAFGAVAPEPPPDYTYQLFGEPIGWQELAQAVQQASAVHVAQYKPQRIHLLDAGGAGEVQASEPLVSEPLARFGDRVALWELACARDGEGQTQLAATWQVEAAVETDALVFLHLLDAEGSLLSQADGHPLLGMLPFWAWQPGQVVRDVRYLDPVPSGEYVVRVGLWEPTTGERWPADEYPDGIVLLPVRCP